MIEFFEEEINRIQNELNRLKEMRKKREQRQAQLRKNKVEITSTNQTLEKFEWQQEVKFLDRLSI